MTIRSRVVRASEIAAHPTHRMDAEYWINRPDVPAGTERGNEMAAATPPIRMELHKRYRVRYIPPLARIPREVVLQYMGPDELSDGREALFSGRPEIGTTSIAFNSIIDATETKDPIQPYGRKVR